MEDFIEIIFYVIIFLISGLGSILKKRNDNKEESTPKPMFQTEDEINDTTAPIGTFDESELIRKLREIEITETKQHEEELIREQELKVKEEAEDIFRKQERIRRENELKIQQEVLERIVDHGSTDCDVGAFCDALCFCGNDRRNVWRGRRGRKMVV
jgi:hypothetical protein